MRSLPSNPPPTARARARTCVRVCTRDFDRYGEWNSETRTGRGKKKRRKRIACIPGRNRNAFSYQASLPRPISAQVPIAKANILTFYRDSETATRIAARNGIGKSRNLPVKKRDVDRAHASQRTITPRRIFTSGSRMPPATMDFTFSLPANHVRSSFFRGGGREQRAHTRLAISLYWSERTRCACVCMCSRGRACTHKSMKFETNRRWNSDEIQLRKTDIPCSCNIKIREPAFHLYAAPQVSGRCKNIRCKSKLHSHENRLPIWRRCTLWRFAPLSAGFTLCNVLTRRN